MNETGDAPTDLMDRLTREIAQADAILNDLHTKVRDAEERRDKAQNLLNGLVEFFGLDVPDLSIAPTPHVDHNAFVAEKPKRRSSSYWDVVAILQEDPARWWEPGDMIAEMERRGLSPDSEDPGGVIRVSLRRAVDRHVAIREDNPDGRGYLYKSAQEADRPAEWSDQRIDWEVSSP